MKTYRSKNRLAKVATRCLEIDLVVILALTLILGLIVGYSLAASRTTTSKNTILKVTSEETDLPR